MKTAFKPMLAANFPDGKGIKDLTYPLIASPKLDGIRCIIHPTLGVVSRSLKPIPNKHIRETLARCKSCLGLDGELTVAGTFQDVTSGVMSHKGKPEFVFTVFDSITNPLVSYAQRIDEYEEKVNDAPDFVSMVETYEVASATELESFLEAWLGQGYEGAIVRNPYGVYKYGRSTFNEGGMIKVKPLEDAEAVIVGFEEQMHNGNEATVSELGRTKRSSAKAGKSGKGTLGALIVVSEEFGRFSIGTGMDDELRARIWSNQKEYRGEFITFTFQRIGTKDKPRIPVFKGFRHGDDR